MCLRAAFAFACALAAAGAQAEETTFSLGGETRARYEYLDGQFRANGVGSDQLLLFRSLIHGKVSTGPVTFGLELQDSRTYLGDEGTPLSNSFTDPLDVLQLYTSFNGLPGFIGGNASTEVILGRQTVSILSKRQIERVSYANVIKAYTGVHAITKNDLGDELHMFHVVPVARFPNERQDIDANHLASDEEQWRRRIFGVHYKRAQITPRIEDLSGELFVYGFEEEDSEKYQTPDRSYLWPGFRLYRPPTRARWDVDIEATYRFGTRRASSEPDDTSRLDVAATMLLARVGYTFDHRWRPRIALQYYGTSGDKNPDDDKFDQFERLFGGRRTDLNNTSIHGPLTPANLNALGVRFDIKPSSRWDARIHYSAAELDSSTDRWVIGKLRDPTGQSGDFIGHAVDTRARVWLWPDKCRLELGASALLFGEFPKNVDNGPEGDRTMFVYSQVAYYF